MSSDTYRSVTTYELHRQGVRRVFYDAETRELRIEFARGQTYAYDAVSEGVVTWLTRTKEPAGYIQRVITPGFTYRKLRQAATQSSCDDDLEASLRASLAKVGVKDPSGN
jgi:hypothetical protein